MHPIKEDTARRLMSLPLSFLHLGDSVKLDDGLQHDGSWVSRRIRTPQQMDSLAVKTVSSGTIEGISSLGCGLVLGLDAGIKFSLSRQCQPHRSISLGDGKAALKRRESKMNKPVIIPL